MFLKTVACYPEKLNCTEPSLTIMKGFQQSEKVGMGVVVVVVVVVVVTLIEAVLM